MGAEIEGQGTQKHKKAKKRGLKKHKKNSTAKSDLWVWFGLQNGWPFRVQNSPKISTIPEIIKMGTRASKVRPRASKIAKSHASDLPKSRKCNCETDKKWHGGGLCAQRTG